jgi:hypothetical protein
MVGVRSDCYKRVKQRRPLRVFCLFRDYLIFKALDLTSVHLADDPLLDWLYFLLSVETLATGDLFDEC